MKDYYLYTYEIKTGHRQLHFHLEIIILYGSIWWYIDV